MGPIFDGVKGYGYVQHCIFDTCKLTQPTTLKRSLLWGSVLSSSSFSSLYRHIFYNLTSLTPPNWPLG